MDNGNKLIKTLCIIIGILSFVFAGLAVNYYTSTLKQKSVDIESSSTPQEPEVLEVKTKDSKKETESKRIELYNIGVTEDAFRKRFNQIADSELSELNLSLTKEGVYLGKYANVYSVPFDSTTSLTISYEPDSELVRGVLLSGQPVTDDETVLFIGAIVNIVATLNPDLSPSGRKELLQKLGMFNGRHTDYKTINTSTYRNNIHYVLRGTNGNGVTFFAVAKDIGTEGGASVKRDAPYNIMADITNYIVWDYDNQSVIKEEVSQEKNSPNLASEGENIENIYAETEAKNVLQSFHRHITYKNFKDAYDCFSYELQGKIPYEGWVDGFRSTVHSTVSDIKVASKSSNQIILTYYLQAEDNPGGIKNFSGTAVLIKNGNSWKLDDITNKER